jgi:hypothetical protein
VVISDGLRKFIDRAIVKSKRERVAGFIANSKNHTKFSRILDHELLGVLDNSNFREPIDVNSLNELGFLYCSNGVSSEIGTSINDLYGEAPWEGGWLIVNLSGSFAIYRPEGKIDDEVFIEL